MTDKDILISDLNDISKILNNNGYGGWCATILKAVTLMKEQEQMHYTLEHDWKMCRELLKEQEEEIENLKQTAQNMMEGVCLMKGQEAVKPTWRQGKAYCGSCGKQIPTKIGARFCHKCGQAVKWE